MGATRDHKFREQWWRQIESDPNPDIDDALLAAAYAISTQARVDGTRALMSNRRLAQILKKNERTAQRRTQKLRDLGYLELADRGGHRGDGTIAANVYELSLPYVDEPQQLTQVTHGEPVSTGHSDDPWAEPQHDTQVSPSDDSQHDTQVSLRDEPQHDKAAPQHDKTESQHDKTTSQHDTQLSAPSLNPSLIPSPNPIREDPPPNVETAAGKTRDRTSAPSGASTDGIGTEIEKQEQDQKRQEEARCKICYAYQSNHGRWLAQLDNSERHEFVPATAAPGRPDEGKRSRRNYAVKNNYQDQKKPRRKNP